MTEYGVVLFHTTSAVMKAEKLLIKQKIKIKLIPTPRQFSTDCGISLRFDWAQKAATESALELNQIETAGIYQLA